MPIPPIPTKWSWVVSLWSMAPTNYTFLGFVASGRASSGNDSLCTMGLMEGFYPDFHRAAFLRVVQEIQNQAAPDPAPRELFWIKIIAAPASENTRALYS